MSIRNEYITRVKHHGKCIWPLTEVFFEMDMELLNLRAFSELYQELRQSQHCWPVHVSDWLSVFDKSF